MPNYFPKSSSLPDCPLLLVCFPKSSLGPYQSWKHVLVGWTLAWESYNLVWKPGSATFSTLSKSLTYHHTLSSPLLSFNPLTTQWAGSRRWCPDLLQYRDSIRCPLISFQSQLNPIFYISIQLFPFSLVILFHSVTVNSSKLNSTDSNWIHDFLVSLAISKAWKPRTETRGMEG